MNRNLFFYKKIRDGVPQLHEWCDRRSCRTHLYLWSDKKILHPPRWKKINVTGSSAPGVWFFFCYCGMCCSRSGMCSFFCFFVYAYVEDWYEWVNVVDRGMYRFFVFFVYLKISTSEKIWGGVCVYFAPGGSITVKCESRKFFYSNNNKKRLFAKKKGGWSILFWGLWSI